MSNDTSAKLIIGCEYASLIKYLDEYPFDALEKENCLKEKIIEKVDEMLCLGELDYASPWYDAPKKFWYIGLELTVDEYADDWTGRDDDTIVLRIFKDASISNVFLNLNIKAKVVVHQF